LTQVADEKTVVKLFNPRIINATDDEFTAKRCGSIFANEPNANSIARPELKFCGKFLGNKDLPRGFICF